jgi:endoglucanase
VNFHNNCSKNSNILLGTKLKQINEAANKKSFLAKYTNLLLIAGFGLVIGGVFAHQTYKYAPKINAKNAQPTDFPVNNCINMSNGLNAPHEGDWSFKFEERHLKDVKEAGFDSIRIPIRWSSHIANDTNHTIDAVFLKRVDEIIGWGLKYNLNIIIDVHDFDELHEDPKTNEPILLDIWKQLSQHYANYPDNLIFEIINEPKDKFSGARVNKTQFAALNIIRQTNPTRNVILAGDNWGDIWGIDNLRLPKNDNHIIATVHYYSPFEFTHQGAEWMGDKAPPKGRIWPRNGEIEQLQNDVDTIAKWRDRLGVPVLMGEYGTDLAVPEEMRIQYAHETTKRFKAANIPTCYFNFASGFAIYDTKTYKWNQAHLRALGLKN